MTILAIKAFSNSQFHNQQQLAQPQTNSPKFLIADILGIKSSENNVSSKMLQKKRLSDQLMNKHTMGSRTSLPLPPPPPPPQFSTEDMFNQTVGKFSNKLVNSNGIGNSSDFDEDDENLNDGIDEGEEDMESDQGE